MSKGEEKPKDLLGILETCLVDIRDAVLSIKASLDELKAITEKQAASVNMLVAGVEAASKALGVSQVAEEIKAFRESWVKREFKAA